MLVFISEYQKHVLSFLIIVSLGFAIVDYRMSFEVHGKTLAGSLLFLVANVNTIFVPGQLGPFVSWQFVSGSMLRYMVNQSFLVLPSLPDLL